MCWLNQTVSAKGDKKMLFIKDLCSATDFDGDLMRCQAFLPMHRRRASDGGMIARGLVFGMRNCACLLIDEVRNLRGKCAFHAVAAIGGGAEIPGHTPFQSLNNEAAQAGIELNHALVIC